MSLDSKKVKPLFLGPKAENQELYESVIIEAIRDNCFLRKNFHSEDNNIIDEKDKLDTEYQKTVADFKQNMQQILADLKKGVPTYHPRCIGHMFGDLLLPAISAYVATMLYNPNNVVGECSPATTKMEFDYIRNLCRMVGYEGFSDTKITEKEIKINGVSKRVHQSWGHLCSGGSSANLESLWAARNMKYYPLAVKLAFDNMNEIVDEVDNDADEKEVKKVNIKDFFEDMDIIYFSNTRRISGLSYIELFNMPMSDILFLRDEVCRKANEYFIDKYENNTDKEKKEKDREDFLKKVQEQINKYSVVKLGVHGIHSLIKIKGKGAEEVKLPKLYIAKSSHYSWDKAMDIVGIGSENLIKVDMSNEFSLNKKNLKAKYDEDKNKKCPILAVIGILGSSKQGSIDSLDEIVRFRDEMEKEEMKSFYFHIDGAFGGYFPALLWQKELDKNTDKSFGMKYEHIEKTDTLDESAILLKYLCDFEDNTNISESTKNFIRSNIERNVQNLYKRLSSVKFADSQTIDPHKMGYVPYPAGCILFKDTRMKEFISYEPSYLNKPDESEEFDVYSAFLGQWTLEGSRPGAAAAACYMSNQLLPFNQSGYGLLIRNTVQMANLFMTLITKFNSDKDANRGYEIFPLFDPETNIVEYVLLNRSKIKKVEYLNILTKKLYEHFSVSSGKVVIPTKKFMVAKEGHKEEDIPPDVLGKIDINNPQKEKIVILSSVFMNPLSIYIDGVEEYYYEFFKDMVEFADNKVMPEIIFKRITDKNNGDRIKVLWVEDEEGVKKTKDLVLYKSILGKYIDIDFCELSKLPLDTSTIKTKTKDKDKTIANAIVKKNKKEQYQVIILDLNLLDKNHNIVTVDNTKTAFEIYQKLDDALKSKVIFCSKFFPKMEKEIMKRFNLVDKDKDRMISKPEKENELNPLINSIFKIFNDAKK